MATLPGICQGKPLGLMTLPLDFTEHALSVNVSPASEPLKASVCCGMWNVLPLCGICQAVSVVMAWLMTVALDFTEYALSVNVSLASEPLQAIEQFGWG